MLLPWPVTVLMLGHAPEHSHDASSCAPALPPPQVRAYWNVKGGVGPSAWQGVMKAYYAASLLTPAQALHLRWQHGPPAVAGEIFTRPAAGSQVGLPACLGLARATIELLHPLWGVRAAVQGISFPAVGGGALPSRPLLRHPLSWQAEGEQEGAAAAAAADEPGEGPMEVDGGTTDAALGVGCAPAVDFPGGSYWGLPAAARVAMLHALINDALECGELRRGPGREGWGCPAGSGAAAHCGGYSALYMCSGRGAGRAPLLLSARVQLMEGNMG